MATITSAAFEPLSDSPVVVASASNRASPKPDAGETPSARRPETTPQSGGIRTFTVAEYHRLAELGILQPDERIELFDGVIVMMSPIGNRHLDTVDTLTELFVTLLLGQARVRIQGSFQLSNVSEPEPDVCVLRLREDSYSKRPAEAQDILLIVEVAESSLEYDRQFKLPRYAQGGIPEYWIVDLIHDVVEIRRKPNGDKYEELQTLRRGETATCTTLPRLKIEVAKVLGPPPAPEPTAETPAA